MKRAANFSTSRAQDPPAFLPQINRCLGSFAMLVTQLHGWRCSRENACPIILSPAFPQQKPVDRLRQVERRIALGPSFVPRHCDQNRTAAKTKVRPQDISFSHVHLHHIFPERFMFKPSRIAVWRPLCPFRTCQMRSLEATRLGMAFAKL